MDGKQILGGNTDVVKMQPKEALMSFPDCPNRCVKGYVLDPYTHSQTICTYCERKRREMLTSDVQNGDNIHKTLNPPNTYNGIGEDIDIGTIIPDNLRSNFTAYSYDNITTKIRELLSLSYRGKLPTYSMLFLFTRHVNYVNFTTPVIKNYYIANVPSVAADNILVTRSRYLYEQGETDNSLPFTYLDLITKQFCIVTVDSGITKKGMYGIAGLMRQRANQGLPTVIVACGCDLFFCNMLCKDLQDTQDYLYVASPFVLAEKPNINEDNNAKSMETPQMDMSGLSESEKSWLEVNAKIQT